MQTLLFCVFYFILCSLYALLIVFYQKLFPLFLLHILISFSPRSFTNPYPSILPSQTRTTRVTRVRQAGHSLHERAHPEQVQRCPHGSTAQSTSPFLHTKQACCSIRVLLLVLSRCVAAGAAGAAAAVVEGGRRLRRCCSSSSVSSYPSSSSSSSSTELSSSSSIICCRDRWDCDDDTRRLLTRRLLLLLLLSCPPPPSLPSRSKKSIVPHNCCLSAISEMLHSFTVTNHRMTDVISYLAATPKTLSPFWVSSGAAPSVVSYKGHLSSSTSHRNSSKFPPSAAQCTGYSLTDSTRKGVHIFTFPLAHNSNARVRSPSFKALRKFQAK